jgi:uncharacterized protein DUF3108
MRHIRTYFSALTLAIILASPLSFAQEGTSDEGSLSQFRYIEQSAFGVGEELIFDVNYGFVTAGEAKMAIPRYSSMKGRKCYHIEFLVRSTSFFDALYAVRDRYQSHLDVGGLFPWKFVQRIREGGYKHDFSAWFDNYKNKAFTKDGVYDIPDYTQDVLSAFYYMRTKDYSSMKLGEEVYLRNFYKDTTYTLTVRYHGKETVEVPAGTFKAIKLEPVMEKGGLFKASGRIYLWLSDDDRKIPILVEAEIPIGSIKSELTRYKGLRGSLESKIE